MKQLLIVGLTAALAFLGLTTTTAAQAAETSFISTWRTTNTSAGSSGASQVRLPLISGGTYNFTVDWGDGQTDTITSYNQAQVTHTYGTSGDKTVTITGLVRGWRFANSGDRLKLTNISQWGPLQLGNDGGYFWGAANLQISATDEPDLSLTDDLSNMFLNASALTGSTLSDWNVSGVKKLVGTFRGATAFNGDISGWNTGQVTAMNSMFRGATSFDRDVSGWDVDQVTSTSSMFRDATAFHRSLAGWTITSLTDASLMFSGASMNRTNYDATLQSWAGQTVKPAVEFDAGTSKYTTGAPAAARAVLVDTYDWTITDSGETAVPGAPPGVGGTRADRGATVTWSASTPNNSAVIDYTVRATAGGGATIPADCVTPANVRTCTFTGLTNGTEYTFTVEARNEVGVSETSSTRITPQIDDPHTPPKPSAVGLDTQASVTWEAPTGGGTPGSYTVTASPGGQTCTTTVGVDANPLTCMVTGLTNGTPYRFSVRASNVGGTSAASPLSNAVTPGPVFATTWDTRNTRQDLGGTGENNLKLPLMLDGNYNFVVAWGDGQVSEIISDDVTEDGLGVRHTYTTPGVYDVTITGTIRGWNLNHGVAGSGEREKLLNVSSWGPLRLGSDTSTRDYFKGATNLQVSATDALDLTGTTSLESTFEDTSAFDGEIGTWDVSGVTDFRRMFAGATSFDSDLSEWETGSATTMAEMFYGAISFNHSVADWDVADVTTMASMFEGASAFNSSVNWTAMPSVSTTADMFADASAFNQAIDWPTTLPQLTSTARMFEGASNFNSAVDLDMDGVTDARRMFAGATSFDQPLDWDTGTVTTMSDMFAGAVMFNQDLSSWDFEQVTRFNSFLNGTSLGIHNYNLLLARWAAQDVQPDTGGGTTTADRTIDVAPAMYSVGAPTADRAELIGRGFTIVDGGQTTLDVPDPPANVGINGDGDSATITWQEPDDHNSPITNYTVTARLKTSPFSEMSVWTTENSYEFDGNLAGGYQAWTIFVTATNAIGTSGPSIADTEPPLTPAAPTVLAGNGQVTVSVTPAESGAQAATYLVEDITSSARSCVITAPATSCVVTGLTNDTAYRFKARASNSVGDSDFSDPSDETAPGVAFTSTWRTGNTSAGSSNANQLRLPLPVGGTYDFYVSWGDGRTDHITSRDQAEVTHTYARAGLKNLTITGQIVGFRFNNQGDRLKLLDIGAWGALRLGNAGSYFYGAENLTGSATDALDLTGTHDLSNAFLEASSFNGTVSGWATDEVTDLTNTFKGATSFTGSGLDTWYVTNVADMYGTFQDSGLTTDISGWQVGAVRDMHATFAGATTFNQPLNTWDTSQVEDMGDIFAGATAFNQDLSAWDTGSVTDLSGAFRDSAFGGDISGWDVSNVTTFENLFRNTAVPAGAAGVGWYNRLLTAWAAQDVVDSSSGPDVVLTVCGTADTDGPGCAAGAPEYSEGAPTRARRSLEQRGWQIADGGPSNLKAPDRVTNVHRISSPIADAGITWDVPADNGSPITSYTVTALTKADLTPTGTCTTYGTDNTADCDLGGDLDDNFYFVVTATNAVGTSEPSLYDAPPAPDAPVAVPGNGSVRAVVSPVDSAEGYTVQVVEEPGITCNITAPDTSCLLGGLTNGNDYTLQARAGSTAGSSAWSDPSVTVSPDTDWFTSEWDTTRTSSGSSSGRTIRLPLTGGGAYDFQVVWGDGVTSSHDTSTAQHTYATGGVKYIAIRGQIDGWRFNNTGDRKKLSDISNWGSLTLGNAGGYFYGATNLTLTATDAPDLGGTTDLSDAFRDAAALTGDLGDWNLSGVTTTARMFAGASSFNAEIGEWNVGAVQDMSGMFDGASSFDQDLSSWDTGAVTDMSNLFKRSAFTHEVAAWDISQVTTMAGMFRGIAPMTGVRFVNWYNRLLISWAAQDTQEDVVLTACGAVDDSVDCPDGLKYYGSAAQDAVDTLSGRGWTLIDGGAATENVPNAPAGIQLSRSGDELTVTWEAPAANGRPITGYTVTTDPGDQVCESTELVCVVDGLSEDENYKYSVQITATNELGTSDPSAPYPVLRPGSPGTPAAVRGDATASVTVPAATTGGPASRYVVTASPGGATCAITELGGPLTCAVPGLTNGVSYTFTATADNDGGTSEPSSASTPVTPIAPAHDPVFADELTRTATGFTVQLENFAADDPFDWEVTDTTGGASASIDGSGLVTVSGAAPGDTVTVTVAATAFGYLDGSAEKSGRALLAALTPEIDGVTRTVTGFQFGITNYLENSEDWQWSVDDPDGDATASLDLETGEVTVDNLDPGEAATVVVTAHKEGHADGTLSQGGQALNSALAPIFGTLTRTAHGFTVQLDNYLDNKDDYDWSVDDPEGPGSASLNETTGLVTVSGLDPLATATVVVTVQREGYVTGSGDQLGQALDQALVPVLSGVNRTADGFRVTIENFGANADDYEWAVSDPDGDPTAILDRNTGEVVVTGADPEESVTVTVTTVREGYATGSADKTGQALKAALPPTFGTVTRTPDGYRVLITNYAANPLYSWTVGNPDGAPTASIDENTGEVVVSNAAPAQSVSVTVTTSRSQHAEGSATTSASALEQALTPEFVNLTRTADGFTADVDNYAGNDTDYQWTVNSDSDVLFSAGHIVVSGLDADVEAEVEVLTERTDYAPGRAVLTARSLKAAVDPDFGTPTVGKTGFTAQIENFDENPGFTWEVTAVTPEGGGAEVGPTGLLTATDLPPGREASVTVTSGDEEHVTGSATVTVTTAIGDALDPSFATPTRTPDGYTVAIDNYDPAYAWTVEETSPESAEAAIDENGVLTVTLADPGEEVEVTVSAKLFGFADGVSSVTGRALQGALTPQFATPTPTADGFTVQIENYLANKDDYVWGTESPTPAGAVPSLNLETGLLTVTGVTPGTPSSVVVTTTKALHAPGSATASSTSINGSARVPDFGTITRTPDGFTVPIDNFSPDWEWEVEAPELPATAELVDGVLVVGGLDPSQSLTVRVTTDRQGYDSGTDTVEGQALNEAYVPDFGTVTRTADGFTVPIENFDGPGTNYQWAVLGTQPDGVEATIDDEGVVTVTGVDPAQTATVTVGTEREEYAPGSNSQDGVALAEALTPDFAPITRTADGFTVLITNYLDNAEDFDWTVSDPVGADVTAALNPATGLITVSGVEPGQSSSVTVTTERAGYVTGSGEQEGAALEEALTPNFGTRTRTADGFTVAIDNYAANKELFRWTALDPEGAPDVALDAETGLVTVSNLAAGTGFTVTVTTERSGFVSGSADESGTALEAAWIPEFATPVPTEDGFTVVITNYDKDDDFDWSITGHTPGGSSAELDADTGEVTVTGVDPGTDADVTVRTTQDGYAPGSATAEGRSLNGPALIPDFGVPTRTADGYEVEIGNLVENADDYEWSVDDVESTDPDAQASLDEDSATLTVTDADPETEVTVTVGTTRQGYDPGSAEIAALSLRAPQAASFTSVTRTPDGFTAEITNYAADDEFDWDISDRTPEGVAATLTDGVVTVTGLDYNTQASVTVATTADGYADGSSTVTGTSLRAPKIPQLVAATRLSHGISTQITGYDTDYRWSVESDHGTASLNDETGAISVTGLDHGQEATVTVRTSRDEYTDGSATVSGSALEAPRDATFGAIVRTADGFRVPITNHLGGFTWQVSASVGTAVIDNAGMVRVTGVAPNTESTVTVTSTRTGYVAGESETTGRSLKAARVPLFGPAVRTADGFEIPITNYNPDFTWQPTATRTQDEVTIDEDGLVTVTGLAPGTASVLRVVTIRDEHADGVAQKTVSSRSGPALKPTFGVVTATAKGFTVDVTNYRRAYTWSGRTSVAGGRVSFDDSGLMTVTGLRPGVSTVVTVTTTRTGFDRATGTVTGRALPAKPIVRPRATAPVAPVLKTLKAMSTRQLMLTWTPRATGGAPITKATATCRQLNGAAVRTVTGKKRNLAVGGLRKGTRYRCVVTVSNRVGTSLQSAPRVAATLAKAKKGRRS